MLYLALPLGALHGWGVCGRYLAKELSALDQVALLTEPFDLVEVGDELDYQLLRGLIPAEVPASPASAPVLQAVTSVQMLPYRPGLRGRLTLGYVFFEHNLLSSRQVENLRENYDFVAVGSSFCEEVLRAHGLGAVRTVVQGVDTSIFHPAPGGKEYFRDRFVVFSGGKFEFRKGQDLVIRAFKVLQDRHRDVLLVNAWYNSWPEWLRTMQASPHIRFQPTATDYLGLISEVLSDNGIDLERVITLLPRPNVMMARICRNTDVGLFPNRCEGGTNLVLMEYMACGRPAIAAFNSGHRDILTPANSVLIRSHRPIILRDGEVNVAEWAEPDLEETIALLEWAYQNRDQLGRIGTQATRDMSALSWRRAAEQFYSLLTEGVGGGHGRPGAQGRACLTTTGARNAGPAAGSA